jgi:hypothetical protein
MDAIAQFTTAAPTGKESPRFRIADFLQQAEEVGFWWQSPRQVAKRLGVPESSFRFHLQRRAELARDPELSLPLVCFLESPTGVEFLHRLLVTLHLVFGLANDCGLRNIGWFLRLNRLDKFLPASYGAQQAFAAKLETLLAEFGRVEEQRLAAQMPHHEITLAADETFHPQICLVAMEPASNYLVLEQYAPQRDAETWRQSLDERLKGWSVTVCQVASDEAKALIALAEDRLGAHHSPDLFHVQHETVQATSLALAGQTRRAHQAAEDAQRHLTEQRDQLTACQQQCPQTTHVAQLQRQVEQAAAAETEARQRLGACQQRQREATEARHGLSHDYHPIDIETVRPVTASEVDQRLSGHFDQLDAIAREAGLSAHAQGKLAKARRVQAGLQATLAFFWATVLSRLAAWQLSGAVATWLRDELLPAVYLEQVAGKASTSAERQRLRVRADEVLARARSPDGVWGTLSEAERAHLLIQARELANLFQRSSSCVEGRNGQLSLRHHGLHRLTTRKLGALRVLHNFLIERPDATTAAERFFGSRPEPVMPWLMARLPMPSHPWRHRTAG